MSSFITNALESSRSTLDQFLSQPSHISSIEKAIACFCATYEIKGRIFSAGNGGSMCDAMHFAEELTGRFRKNRSPLAAMAISDPAHLSCVANDYGFQYVFSRTIEAFGKKGDCFLAISTSGQSENIIQAVHSAKAQGMTVIGLLGKDGGKLKELVDIPLLIPSTFSDRIQEIHIKCIHIFIEGIERNIFPENYL